MKKTAAMLILLTTPFVSHLGAQTRRIAVYDFDQTAVNADVLRIYGSANPVGKSLSSYLISKLLGSGGQFEVIDRGQIDNIMKEQNLKFSDRFDPSEAPKLGKLLNVDAIVTGSITTISAKVQNGGFKLGGYGLQRQDGVATVTANVRVISTETAKIMMAEAVKKDEKKSLGQSTVVAGGSSSSSAQGAHPESEIAEQALQAAGEELAVRIAAKAAAMPARISTITPPPSASLPGPAVTALKVGRVDGSKVYIAAGESAGLKEGDTFDVRRVTGSFKNEQGVDIDTDETIEQIVIQDVQEQFAVGKPAHPGASLAKQGDRLRKSRTPASGK
jgi:curli biogenesis system outer membrane secretion channel CsgG